MNIADLNDIIGQGLNEVKIQSFYLDEELISQINVVYLKFNYWISIILEDSITSIQKVDESNIIRENQLKGEFKYSIKDYSNRNGIKERLGRKLIDFKELVWKKDISESYGVVLYFEDNHIIGVHNNLQIEDMELIFNKEDFPQDLIIKDM